MASNTTDNSQQILALYESIREADSVIIGAGSGLSTSAGFVYDGERFDEYFSDFQQKYGFSDMYTGGFYPYETKEEYWAYWSRYIYVNRYLDAPKPVYDQVLELVDGKDYFVITTNVDHCFQKAGIDKQRLFYTQGDYGLYQCTEPCQQVTYDNRDSIRKMLYLQKDMKIPSDLLPKCPNCGRDMTVNLRSDNNFVEDEGWHEASQRYEDYVNAKGNGKILYLELGVGYNTPVIIKFPFWKWTKANEEATYASINYNEAEAPEDIIDRSILIQDDIGDVVSQLLDLKNKE